MIDLTRTDHRDVVDGTAEQALLQKRRAALAYLGANWVLHPRYQPVPRHSNTKPEYFPHRTLAGVEFQARMAGRI